MLIFTCEAAYLCEHLLQTLHPAPSQWQLQKGFHRERAHPVLPNSTCASAPPLALAPCIPASSAISSSISWELNQCFPWGNLLHLPAQVLLVAGGYRRGTWEWVAWEQHYFFFRQRHSFQALSQLTKDYWHVFLLPISTICTVPPLSLCQLSYSPDTHVSGANFHYRQKQT